MAYSSHGIVEMTVFLRKFNNYEHLPERNARSIDLYARAVVNNHLQTEFTHLQLTKQTAIPHNANIKKLF